ncbi:hypothetical protein BX600DRAFT_440900 [Xylariales sp. PMI_506]|nr:hypothetical protein BX600DRAFT_440900 [Xylariales sp. PMI_506]
MKGFMKTLVLGMIAAASAAAVQDRKVLEDRQIGLYTLSVTCGGCAYEGQGLVANGNSIVLSAAGGANTVVSAKSALDSTPSENLWVFGTSYVLALGFFEGAIYGLYSVTGVSPASSIYFDFVVSNGLVTPYQVNGGWIAFPQNSNTYLDYVLPVGVIPAGSVPVSVVATPYFG